LAPVIGNDKRRQNPSSSRFIHGRPTSIKRAGARRKCGRTGFNVGAVNARFIVGVTIAFINNTCRTRLAIDFDGARVEGRFK
jgi:hypothetical protein